MGTLPISIIRCFTGYFNSTLYGCCLLLALGVTGRLSAQISPPGLSDTRLATWMAIGLDQSLNKQKSWLSMSYVGYGFMSHPKRPYHAFEKPSMFIVNQEVKRKLTDRFSLTGALSYRQQYLYSAVAPYHKADPAIKKELRFYGKFTFNWKTHQVKFNIDFRPEYRKFFLSDFGTDDPHNALRARFKLKATKALTSNKLHWLILSAESLFQNERVVPTLSGKGNWSGFFYDDSRFCLYYRYQPDRWPLYGEIGYMNNLTGKSPTIAMHHIGVDIVFKGIF